MSNSHQDSVTVPSERGLKFYMSSVVADGRILDTKGDRNSRQRDEACPVPQRRRAVMVPL
jgi:hypothetical protein